MSGLLSHPSGRSLMIDRACRDCALCQERTQVVVHRGRLDASVLFIGEGPGAEEDRLGRPFVGRSGKMLDQWLAALGLGDNWCITNIVRCRPPENRVPNREEQEACWKHLQAFIAFVQPKVIVAIGATAGKFLERQKVPHLKVKHPSYFVRGYGGPWPPEIERLKGELNEKLVRC